MATIDHAAKLARIRDIIGKAKRFDTFFAVLGLLSLMVGVLTFAALFADMAVKGLPRIDYDFFTNFPSRRAGSAGILSAWVGTILVMIVTALAAVPLGVAAGVYLEEYAPKNWITDVIEINITNLAGVPSIVYGLLGTSASSSAVLIAACVVEMADQAPGSVLSAEVIEPVRALSFARDRGVRCLVYDGID